MEYNSILAKQVQALLAVQGVSPDSVFRMVTKVRLVEKGPNEGALEITSKPAIGIMLSTGGFFLFSEEDGKEEVHYSPPLPPGFPTGNEAVDKERNDENSGEEWKNGG